MAWTVVTMTEASRLEGCDSPKTHWCMEAQARATKHMSILSLQVFSTQTQCLLTFPKWLRSLLYILAETLLPPDICLWDALSFMCLYRVFFGNSWISSLVCHRHVNMVMYSWVLFQC